jgi:hypothetical protein
VTVQRVSGRQRHLDVDRAALGQRIERRPAPGLLRDGRPERTGSCLLHGQPHASHAHRPASRQRGGTARRPDHEAPGLDLLDLPDLVDTSGKHRTPFTK